MEWRKEGGNGREASGVPLQDKFLATPMVSALVSAIVNWTILMHSEPYLSRQSAVCYRLENVSTRAHNSAEEKSNIR